MAANGKQKEIVEEITTEQIVEPSESEDSEAEVQDTNVPSASTPSTSSKSKKKKRSKAAKALNALRGNVVPQEVVDVVLDKVRDGHGESVPGGPSAVTEESVRLALERLKLQKFLEGKAGLGGKNTKDVGAHKVGSEMLRD